VIPNQKLIRKIGQNQTDHQKKPRFEESSLLMLGNKLLVVSTCIRPIRIYVPQIVLPGQKPTPKLAWIPWTVFTIVDPVTLRFRSIVEPGRAILAANVPGSRDKAVVIIRHYSTTPGRTSEVLLVNLVEPGNSTPIVLGGIINLSGVPRIFLTRDRVLVVSLLAPPMFRIMESQESGNRKLRLSICVLRLSEITNPSCRILELAEAHGAPKLVYPGGDTLLVVDEPWIYVVDVSKLVPSAILKVRGSSLRYSGYHYSGDLLFLNTSSNELVIIRVLGNGRYRTIELNFTLPPGYRIRYFAEPENSSVLLVLTNFSRTLLVYLAPGSRIVSSISGFPYTSPRDTYQLETRSGMIYLVFPIVQGNRKLYVIWSASACSSSLKTIPAMIARLSHGKVIYTSCQGSAFLVCQRFLGLRERESETCITLREPCQLRPVIYR